MSAWSGSVLSMIVSASLSADLEEQGVPARAFVTLGTRPSAIRFLPAFWGSFGCRVLWVLDDGANLAATTMHHQRLDHLITSAPVSDLDVSTRLGGRQLMVRFPGGERVVIEGRSDVRLARDVLEGRAGGTV